MHAGLLERKAAQEEPANQMGEERVDRDRAKATLGASVPLDGPLEVRKSLSRGRPRVRAQQSAGEAYQHCSWSVPARAIKRRGIEGRSSLPAKPHKHDRRSHLRRRTSQIRTEGA
jgi:hypothetical protein